MERVGSRPIRRLMTSTSAVIAIQGILDEAAKRFGVELDADDKRAASSAPIRDGSE